MYKDVVHDRTGVGEAADLLDKIMKRKDKFSVWLRILMFGVASACVVSPFVLPPDAGISIVFVRRKVSGSYTVLIQTLLGISSALDMAI